MRRARLPAASFALLACLLAGAAQAGAPVASGTAALAARALPATAGSAGSSTSASSAAVASGPAASAAVPAAALTPMPGGAPDALGGASAGRPALAASGALLGAPSVASPISSTQAVTSAGNLLQTILALCLVLALLAGFAWFMKRYGPKNAGAQSGLRIVGALNLGGRERIIVVEVGDQWIVVGASPGRVNGLATMPRQAPADQSAMLSGDAPAASSFSEWLKQTIDKRNAN